MCFHVPGSLGHQEPGSDGKGGSEPGVKETRLQPPTQIVVAQHVGYTVSDGDTDRVLQRETSPGRPSPVTSAREFTEVSEASGSRHLYPDRFGEKGRWVNLASSSPQ